jgi:hypothetical protein
MALDSLTAAAFVLMFLPIFAFGFLERRQRTAALRLLAKVGVAMALYCVAAGIAMLAGWPDPMSTADWRATRAFQYWPYGLIVAGAFWTIVYGATHLAARRR